MEENGDPCPLTPAGGNREASTTCCACAAVLTIGTMSPLEKESIQCVDYDNLIKPLGDNSLCTAVECTFDVMRVDSPDPHDGRHSARSDGIDAVVHIRIADIAYANMSISSASRRDVFCHPTYRAHSPQRSTKGATHRDWSRWFAEINIGQITYIPSRCSHDSCGPGGR